MKLSQNTNLYLTTHNRTDFGKQAQELHDFKTLFLENGNDLNKEIPEYLPAILELATGGIPAGLLFFGGFFFLMQRRFSYPKMAVNTSKMDGVLYAILFCAIATGCLATALNATGILGDFNYRETIFTCFRSNCNNFPVHKIGTLPVIPV